MHGDTGLGSYGLLGLYYRVGALVSQKLMIQPSEVFYGFAQTMPRSLGQCGGKCIIFAQSKG